MWLRAFAFREAILNPAFGVQAARVTSSALLAILVVVLAFLSRRYRRTD